MKKLFRNIALLISSVILALGGSELIVRFVVDPVNYLRVDLVPDPVLGHRVQPYASGHDKWGYRNLEVPESARLVAIGDSQTYGVNATMRQSWPYQLGELLDEKVYQLALGGYGPIEYLRLLETQAQQLKPHIVLIGIYLGNDSMDAARAVQMRDYWKDWRQSNDVIPEPSTIDASGRHLGWLRDYLGSRSVLYGMLRATFGPLLHSLESGESAYSSTPNKCWVWNDPYSPNTRTIFTPEKRLFALDPDSSSVHEGTAITQKVIDRIGEIQHDHDWNIYIVMIPTKEYVYCDLIELKDAPKDFASLCIAEDNARTILLQRIQTAGLKVIDVTSSLREKAEAHYQIYPQTEDGHPNNVGYAAFAHVIFNQLMKEHTYKQ